MHDSCYNQLANSIYNGLVCVRVLVLMKYLITDLKNLMFLTVIYIEYLRCYVQLE